MKAIPKAMPKSSVEAKFEEGKWPAKKKQKATMPRQQKEEPDEAIDYPWCFLEPLREA